MKQSFKLKPSFKQFIKMLFMFIGVFILTFLILLGVAFLTANAAEPAELESTTSVEQSDAETSSREGGGHRIGDSSAQESTGVEPALSDEEIASIHEEIDSILEPSDVTGEDASVDEEETVNSGNTIIVYQLPTSTISETSADIVYYDSLEDYESSTDSALSYGEYVINEKLDRISVLLAFCVGFEFIIMIAAWRKRT